jgi:hypothetical protein
MIKKLKVYAGDVHPPGATAQAAGVVEVEFVE